MKKNTSIKTALVSTNSITQGEQVNILWRILYERFKVHIDFAYRTFRWDSEANIPAHVHCVIIGFNCSIENKSKTLFLENGEEKQVKNINPYLLDAPSIIVSSRSKSICNVPKMDFGSMPNDNGYLSKYSSESKDDIVHQYPESERFFKCFLGAEEFLHNKTRWCLWLKNVNLSEVRHIKPIIQAIQNVRSIRSSSKRSETRKLAEIPMLFGEIRQPDNVYLLVPRHSSENRKYIPIGYVNPDIICGDSNHMIPNATLYHFGILTSKVHMDWMRTVAGRLEMRYRYSSDVVYNNFPWPSPSKGQKKKIEETAQSILNARALYPNSSLAQNRH